MIVWSLSGRDKRSRCVSKAVADVIAVFRAIASRSTLDSIGLLVYCCCCCVLSGRCAMSNCNYIIVDWGIRFAVITVINCCGWVGGVWDGGWFVNMEEFELPWAIYVIHVACVLSVTIIVRILKIRRLLEIIRYLCVWVCDVCRWWDRVLRKGIRVCWETANGRICTQECHREGCSKELN